ncbi:hypothetical protein L611_000100001130 [Aminobacter sp. J15]|nr:hypothetical protein L611_000100001130 [Aminobacter sp. J15]
MRVLRPPRRLKGLRDRRGGFDAEGQALLVKQIDDWKGYVAAAGIVPE